MDHRRPDDLTEYAVLVAEISPTGGWVRELRELLAAQALDTAQRAELDALDAILIEALREGDIEAALLDDDAAAPLAHWWWHLGAIRAGSYPEALLPETLRAPS